MKILTNLDLSQNEIQNAIMQPLAAPPSNPILVIITSIAL